MALCFNDIVFHGIRLQFHSKGFDLFAELPVAGEFACVGDNLGMKSGSLTLNLERHESFLTIWFRSIALTETIYQPLLFTRMNLDWKPRGMPDFPYRVTGGTK